MHATVDALRRLERPEAVAARRGLPLEDVAPPAMLRARARAAASGSNVVTQLRITQIRSGIGGKQNQRDTLRTLGLHRISQTVVREDKPEVRGMVKTVAHLVTVEEVEA